MGAGPDVMILGARIELRPIEERDIPHLRAWQSDPAVMTGWAMPHPLVAHDAFVDDMAGRFRSFADAGYFVIEHGGGAIGRIDFHGFDERHRCAELALYIGERTATGKGFARDAVHTLTSYLFSERRAARVELTVIESNTRARRLYESLGFRTEGVLRDYVHFGGRWHSEVQMAMYDGAMLVDPD